MADKKKPEGKKQVQLDKRVVDRLIQRGTMPRDEFEAHLKALPDLTEQAENIADKVYQDR